MNGFGGEQRRVRFPRFVEQLEHAPGLLAVQPDDRLAFENFLRLAMSGLPDEVVERRAFEISGGLEWFPARPQECVRQRGTSFRLRLTW